MTYVAIVAIFVLIVLLLDAALENREVDRSRQDRAGPDRPEGERVAMTAVVYEFGRQRYRLSGNPVGAPIREGFWF